MIKLGKVSEATRSGKDSFIEESVWVPEFSL